MPSNQTPQAFGRVRLVFLETNESFLAATVWVSVDGQRAELPIGKVDGVNAGAVFISRWEMTGVFLTIEKVDNLTSIGSMSGLLTTIPEFVPFQWYSEKPSQIYVDASLKDEFCTDLEDALQDRIASKFRLHKPVDDRISIDGPRSLDYYPGTAWCLDTGGKNSKEIAINSADSLAHLFRYTKLYELRDQTSMDKREFTARLSLAYSCDDPIIDGQKFKYTFKNDSDIELYFAVLNLSPGFSIEQIFPSKDESEEVAPHTPRSFEIGVPIPDELHRGKASCELPYREIIRTVVTRDKSLSLKSIELPEIWDATALQCEPQPGPARGDGQKRTRVVSDFAFWIEDIVMYTSPEPEESQAAG
ncbi:uncharacterized protein PG986_006702 [Apiospora aurea]|uniref:Uncharacterized protein n=1 Tax=Apiospora aurea TaxID=335848 RepID=A0ABR1QAI9_9PEZI